ncbi:Hypothetical protein GLP15_4161 [Giardia lamblia P15]|uniref:Uncharacterized protein n=1 Tax=Giardia intestinalis (strain P15) TaxID=658858 RepID=E1F6K2_GIAIA|nr:Hypothetical protein GLP15_4161 [Giardia lamblia P15]
MCCTFSERKVWGGMYASSVPETGVPFVRLRARAVACLRNAFSHFRGCFHFKALLPFYPAPSPNLRPSLALHPDKIIYRLIKWTFIPYTLLCVTSILLLSENSTAIATLSYWPHYPIVLSLHFFFVTIYWTYTSPFNLYTFMILHFVRYDKSQLLLSYLSLLYCFTGTNRFRTHTTNYSYSAIHSSTSQPLCQNLITEETTDDFGAGDEVYDSITSVSVSTTSTARKSTTGSRYNVLKRSKGLLTTTTKSEAIWIELELERYPKMSTPFDEEDSLDNRDTDKVVSMKPNKTISGSSLESDMAGTGAGALSKDHILALSGKAVVVSSLANIILTPEQAEKAMKAKNKMLKLRNSQRDVCICEGNCGAHFSLPKQRYLEYMMSTDELGEVVFTPYLGVGVAHKHIQMPPLKVFIVGSKANGNKMRPERTNKRRTGTSSKRSESSLDSVGLLSQSTMSQRASNAKCNPAQLESRLSIKDLNEQEGRLISRMDKIVPLAPVVLTTPNKKRNLPLAPLPYTHNRSPEWSDLEEDKDNDKVCNNQVERSEKYNGSIDKLNVSSGKCSGYFDIRAIECNDKTSISVSDWDDLST